MTSRAMAGTLCTGTWTPQYADKVKEPCAAVVVGGCSIATVVYGGMFARRAPGALLLDYVPPEEPPSTPLGNALRIR